MTNEEKDRAICENLSPQPPEHICGAQDFGFGYDDHCPGCDDPLRFSRKPPNYWIYKNGWQPRNTLEPEMTVLMLEKLVRESDLTIIEWGGRWKLNQPVGLAVIGSTLAEAVQSAYLKAFGLEG